MSKCRNTNWFVINFIFLNFVSNGDQYENDVGINYHIILKVITYTFFYNKYPRFLDSTHVNEKLF